MKKTNVCCLTKRQWLKFLVMIKSLFILLIVGVISANAVEAYSQSARFDLSLKKSSLKSVLKEIEDKTEFYFFYKNDEIIDINDISIEVSQASISDVLDDVLKNRGFKYEILDRYILLQKIDENDQAANQDVNKKSISGTVTDNKGEPLPGVTVFIKGTTNGAVTDESGKYNLYNVDDDAIVVFSFMGLKSIEIPVKGQSIINASLVENSISIDEVVAVGYGTMKRSDLTGSIGSIDNGKLTSKGVTSTLEAMQGEVAGVIINSTNGRAGSNFDIKIRGDNSLVGGSPLYVVDGLVTGNIQFLNPQDIERIDILKDASSTAIYGSRGSNGVVIITTKQASDIKDQKPSISYAGYYGVRTPARLPDLMDGDEYWEYRENAYLGAEFYSGNDITQPEYDQTWLNERTGYDASVVLQDILANKDYVNWYDEMLKNGSQQNHWISISGRSSEKMSYLIGMGYQNEEGVFDNEWYDRYNFKASINHEISEKWSAGTNVNIALSEAEIGEDRNANVYEAFDLPPVVAAYIPEGYENAGGLSLYPSTDYDMGINGQLNPLVSIQNLQDMTRTLNVVGNVYLQYSPIKDVRIKTTFSPYLEYKKRGIYQGSETGQRALQDPAANLTQSDYLTYAWDNQIDYSKAINDHQFNLTALYSMNSSRYESSYISVENLPFESLWHNLGSANDIVEVKSGFTKSTLVSVLARLNYSYKGKYMATASFRTDGSSKLSTGEKWSNFPSVALAWRASEEGFLNDVERLSNLKFRLSYGYTGNNNIGAYSTLRYASVQKYYDFDGVSANGFTPSNIANSALTWEKTREFNLGLDIGFFDNRINGSIDIYDKLSSGLLMDRRLALETGWQSVTANIGSVSNKGIEVLLNTVNISTRNFKWETTFSFSKNNNKIEELYGGDEDDLGNLWFIGEPVNVNYTYVFDGIWQADQVEEAAVYGQLEGQARVKDLDDNDIINSADRTIIGTPDPTWFGHFSTSLSFKGFDLNATLFTQQGSQVMSEFHRTYIKYDERWRNKLNLNYYMVANNVHEARVSNEYPMPRNSGQYWGKEDVGFYKDVSFVKVKNISLGYTIDPKSLGKVDIKSLRFYVNVLNPFVFTDFDGFDPEWAGRSRNGGGVSTITYQFGVNANF